MEAELDSISFTRKVLNEGKPANLFLFCDASKTAYGFAACDMQDGHSTLIFAKTKVAPLKSKPLTTLELLSVFLVFFPSLKDISIEEVYVTTDVQVVLVWILAKTINTKNIFAHNRLRDITQITAEIKSEFELEVNLKYVLTADNPADYITKGLTLKKFKVKLKGSCVNNTGRVTLEQF